MQPSGCAWREVVRKRLSAVMNWLAIPEDTETLATYLQRHGFHTGGFTSIWTVERRFGYARGFDVFVDRMPTGSRRVE